MIRDGILAVNESRPPSSKWSAAIPVVVVGCKKDLVDKDKASYLKLNL